MLSANSPEDWAREIFLLKAHHYRLFRSISTWRSGDKVLATAINSSTDINFICTQWWWIHQTAQKPTWRHRSTECWHHLFSFRSISCKFDCRLLPSTSGFSFRKLIVEGQSTRMQKHFVVGISVSKPLDHWFRAIASSTQLMLGSIILLMAIDNYKALT
jgi:hypothetical protein